MARIEGVPAKDASLLVRLAYWMARRMFKKVPEPLAVTAHNAPIFRAAAGYEFFLGKASRVEARLKALASLKAAAMIGCPF
jgi:alkylhydroperoxidase family enzyme